MKTVKRIFNAIFPFAITLVLWRLAAPFWNPCGILALVPIFYYSFIAPKPGFVFMAIIGCFLIDYSFDAKLFWTSMFGVAYAANYFQTVMRGAVTRDNGIWAFMVFMGVCLLILGIGTFVASWSVSALGQMIWFFVLTVAAYFGWIKVGARITKK